MVCCRLKFTYLPTLLHSKVFLSFAVIYVSFGPKDFTQYTGLFISPSGISELDCATTKTEKAERRITREKEPHKEIFFFLGALVYLQVTPLGGSRDEKWRSR